MICLAFRLLILLNLSTVIIINMSILPKIDSVEIREVWDDNLEQEFALIRDVVDAYPYIAMDTEFPGIVLRRVAKSVDQHYQVLKDNVDLLKMIQLGLTFSDEQGNLPKCGTDDRFCIWQFNFREFNVNEDAFANDSIELLRQCGIDFDRNNQRGVDVLRFGELLMSCGVVLIPDVHWITFHSGYDFGYLLKALTCNKLPDTQTGFFKMINIYFSNLYDIKHLMKFCNSLHGGLNKLAVLLDVQRVGVSHQAGSDSFLEEPLTSWIRKLQMIHMEDWKHMRFSWFCRIIKASKGKHCGAEVYTRYARVEEYGYQFKGTNNSFFILYK